MGDEFFGVLEKDDVFRQFLLNEFDAKAYATKIIQSHAVSQQLAKLAEGINVLDKELHCQVVDHYEDLLSQATGIETLEGVLQMMQTRIQSLLMAMDRIKSRVVEPYNKILNRTVQLRRLQETCDILRHIIRLMYLSKRLHSQLQGGSREITKAAQSLNELDYLSTSVDFSGIDVIEADRRFIKQARKEVEVQAQKMMEQGIEMQNQTQAATALQVFYNLNNLESTIHHIMTSSKQHLRDSIHSALDIDQLTNQISDKKGMGPGRVSGLSTTGNTAAFRAALWTNMEKLADSIYSHYSQILHLQKVLTRKRDPVTHVLFMDYIANKNKDLKGENLLQDLWKSVTGMLTEEFLSSAENNAVLRQVLDGEFPKLLRLFTDLWRRIQSLGDAGGRETGGEVGGGAEEEGAESNLIGSLTLADQEYDPEKALRDCLSRFENAYLSKSLSRLFDPINLVFSSSSANPPTDQEIEGIVKAIVSELSISSFDVRLSISIARNIAKTLIFFCTKSEQLLITSSDASQVIGVPTSSQTHNASVVNSLYKLHQSVAHVIQGLTDLPDAGMVLLREALQKVTELMGNAIQPLLSNISKALTDIILTVHNEDFSQGYSGDITTAVEQQQQQQCSLYMKELHQFISRVSTTYLTQYNCIEFIMLSVNPIACRCLELFVRHTSLVAPLGEGGKLRLSADYAQMETSIQPLCNKVSELGKSYRLIRAVRPMLYQAAEHMARSQAVGDVVPYSLIVQLLFSRSYPTLKSPYQSAGWTCQRYSEWLDEHPQERDRLLYLKGSLESYVQQVTSKGGREFVPAYPIMIDLVQKGLQQQQQQQ